MYPLVSILFQKLSIWSKEDASPETCLPYPEGMFSKNFVNQFANLSFTCNYSLQIKTHVRVLLCYNLCMPTREYAYQIFNLLKMHYPNAKMILQWYNNFELLVAIILSAQCTDKKVNEVTAKLFLKYKQERPEFESQYQNYTRTQLPKEQLVQMINMAYVPLIELEQDIRSTGFYHNKAKNIQEAARIILDKYKGVLPQTITELTTIPGVGRKTANVFLGNAYGIYEGIAVDTHVIKQSQALGLTYEKTPEKIEQDLMKLFDKKDWFTLTYLLIEHGRNTRKRKQDRAVCIDKNCLLCNQ